VNSTFYRVPEPDLVRSWVRRTPPDFVFSAKLYQKFTHPDMYSKQAKTTAWDVTSGDLDLFRRGLDPMAEAGRLGALLVQFPASFRCEPDTIAYVDWLTRALREYPVAVEIRHRSWSDSRDALLSCLASTGATWAYIDEPKFASSVRQGLDTSSAPRGSTPGAPLYIRLHGRNADAWWEHDQSEDRYEYLYRPEELAPFAAAARDAASRGRRVLMYLNNHFSAKSVANAVILKHQLGEPASGTFPIELVRTYPELQGLVATDELPLGS
jgi:uncharacterized protein YecE (DUF72 family)